jgi:hypothetical protein
MPASSVPVTIDANGVAHPDHATPSAGQSVRWNCNKNFTINFKNGVDHPNTHSDPGGGFRADSKVWGGDDKGKQYEYTIETVDAGGRPVIIDPFVDVQP